MTGLPFVFAAWISNKALDQGWVRRFNQANAFGIQNIPRVLEQLSNNDIDLKEYFTHYLSYDFNEEKKKGLNLFLTMLAENA
jgi:chorismate dehydratase